MSQPDLPYPRAHSGAQPAVPGATAGAGARTRRPDRAVRLPAGVPVLTRGDGLLQVGSDPARRVLLPDTTSVRRLLQLLPYGVRTSTATAVPEVVQALESGGLLVDDDEQRLLTEARRATRVRAVTPAWWRALVEEVVGAAGLGLLSDDDTSPADVTLVLSWGEPDRDGLDLLVSRDEPWLPVAALENRVRVGPFVVAGDSACLRCVDAHEAGHDPWHRVPRPLPADSPPGGSPPGGSVPVDPLVLRHGLLAAVTDLARWAEGRRPMTWSATLTHRAPMQVERRSWSRHPHCGCTWGDDLPTG